MKRLFLTIFFSILFCGQALAEGNIIDRFATDAETTAQTRDDVGLTPANISSIMAAPGTVSKLQLDHNVELLNAGRAILITDKPVQWYDCNGTDRNVTLPAEATNSTDLVFTIYNNSDGAYEDLVIRDDTPTTLITIGPGQGTKVSCDGTSWKVLNDKGIIYDTIDKSLDFQGNYALQLQNVPDLASRGAGYWFDGTDDVITISDNADLDFGTVDDFYIEMEVMPVDVTRTTDYLANKEAGGIGYGLYINQDDLYIRLDDNTHDVSAIIGAAVFSNYVRVHILVSFDRSGDATAYINGKPVGTVDISSVTSTISSAGNLHIGQDSAGGNEFYGEVSKGRIGNLTKTATEVKALSSGASVPYKYTGASQTDVLSGWDFTAGWGVSNATVNDADTFTVNVSSGSIYKITLTTFGKKYRMRIAGTAAGGISDFTVLGSSNYKSGMSGTFDETFTFVADHTNGAITLRCTGTGQVDITTLELVQIGCVLQLEQDGIGYNQWVDNSGNELHGTVSGALPTNLPANHQEKYIDLTLTGNSSFTLPMGYQIKSIIAKETAGNALTGGLDVGLSANGVEVVSGMAVAGSATVLCTLVEAGTIGGTFTTADDTIYFSDGDDNADWNSAELELRIHMQKLTLN